MNLKIKILVLVSAAVALFLLGRGCGSAADDQGSGQVDSLSSEIARVDVEAVRYKDSVVAEALGRDIYVRQLQADYQGAKDLLKQIGARADRYIVRTVTDTVLRLAECDTLRDQFALYREAASSVISDADSVINEQAKEILSLKDLAEVQAKEIKLISSDAEAIRREFNDMEKRKKRKNNFWHRWAAPVAAFILGALTIHTLK